MQIQINVVGKIATAVGNPYLVCGNSNDTILFTFDSEWKSYSAKTARFIYEVDGEEKYTEVAFSGTTCKVPVLTGIKKVDIGVYAGGLATTRCKINCKTSILDGEGSDEGAAHGEPGEDIYNQIMELCNEAVTTANNTAAKTDLTFANALKGNIYGAAVRADDVSPVEHNLACKVESKNLIPYPYSEKNATRNGIAFTIDENDKGIVVDGTATVNTSFNWLSSTSNKLKIEKGQTYTFSCNMRLTSAKGYIFLQNSINGVISDRLFIQQETVTFTATETGYASLGVVVLEGATFNNEKILVQLEKGDTATEYTPYVDPSTAKVTRCGKNFWRNENEKFPKTISGVTVEYDPETQIYTFNGTSTATGDVYTFPRDTKILNIKAGETWTLTTEVIGGNIDNKENPYGKLSPIINTAAYDNGLNTSVALSANKKFIQSADITKMYFYIYASNIVFNNFKCRVQLELSDNATEFEKFKEATKYTPNADGTVEGITSLAPSMTLLTDTANTFINCEYNRDINAVIADIYSKITG